MGRITCANVVSDLYAMGVTQIDCLRMMLKISNNMTKEETEVVVPLMIQGFRFAANEAGCKVRSFTVLENPWCTIGGIATAVCTANEFIKPENACVSDAIVLTKALGTQIACSVHHWIDIPEKWSKIKDLVTKDELEAILKQAVLSMARLNRVAATLMHKYNAHCCTDVTGFGILGHAKNLVSFQKNKNLDFVIEKLPVFQNVDKVAKACNLTKLFKGISPETSGGLLICMAEQDAQSFCEEIEKIEQQKAWIVGHAIEGHGVARLVNEPEIIEAVRNF